MVRAGFAGLIVAVLAASGCSQSPEPYLEVVRERRAAQKEITDILAGIEDEKSLATARAALDERYDRFEKMAQKAKDLPPPSDAVRVRLEQERFVVQATAANLQDQVRRVSALKLPGGTEFFKHFESKYQGLFQAVQP